MSISGTLVPLSASLAFVLIGGCSNGSSTTPSEDTNITAQDEVQSQHQAKAEHCVQEELNSIEDSHERFEAAFDCGDELFDTVFNSLDGVGAYVGPNQRFTRMPRADMVGPGEWANHTPARATGPNAQSCIECHALPFSDGAGGAAGNVFRDPQHTGLVTKVIMRNAPHLFGLGALQVLAQDMSETLIAQRDAAREQACAQGDSVTVSLEAKGIGFGEMIVQCDGNDDTSGITGVSTDLLIRPYQWKGSNITLRDFNRGAGHDEIGMQAVEIAGDDVDGDGDGVVNELGIGDITSLSLYLASQPRPVSKLELRDLGLATVTREEEQAIRRGSQVFDRVGCDNCHTPRLDTQDVIFAEPSADPNYRDAVFPAGQDPLERGVDPDNAVFADLTADQPDNIVTVPGRNPGDTQEVHLGSFESNGKGGAIVRLYGDLKRHDMGPELAEPIDEVGTGPATFMTENLWGVGSTEPYLHDGRATTLTEAILAHGGDAQEVRDAYMARSQTERTDLLTFLNNLVLFKLPEPAVPEE